MITGLHKAGGKRDSTLEQKQNPVYAKTQWDRAVTPQETEPDLPASGGGSTVVVWAGSGLPWGWGDRQQWSWKGPFGVSPLGHHD